MRVTATDETGLRDRHLGADVAGRPSRPAQRAPARGPGGRRFTRTVKVTRGAGHRADPDPLPVVAQLPDDPGSHQADLPARCGRCGTADQGPRVRQEARLRPGQATARGEGAVGHRVAVRRTVTYRIETRGRITTSVREFRRPPRTYDDPRGWRNAGVASAASAGRRLLPRPGRGELAARLLVGLQRRVELPGRPLRDHQPGALEVRLTGVERRRQEPARLPAPGRQPRDRPLARPRPRRLPGPRSSGAGDDAAVQGRSAAVASTRGRPAPSCRRR